MIALIQRVTQASVKVQTEIVGAIDYGLLAFIAIEPDDDEAQAKRMLERLFGYRVFPDAEDKMNLSLKDIGGGLLLVPQFTLAANTQKGMRPSFASAASPTHGQQWFERLLALAREAYPKVATGRFGAHMEVSLINDGPVTFWLKS